MIAITNIFFQGFVNEVLQLFIKTHSCNSTTSSFASLLALKSPVSLERDGAQEYFVLALFNRLKPDILYDFSSVLCFHKNIGAEFTGICLQGAYTIVSSR